MSGQRLRYIVVEATQAVKVEPPFMSSQRSGSINAEARQSIKGEQITFMPDVPRIYEEIINSIRSVPALMCSQNLRRICVQFVKVAKLQ